MFGESLDIIINLSSEIKMKAPISISEHIAGFRDSKSILSLIKATGLLLKQRRSIELLYGIYCGLYHHPSPILNDNIDDFRKFLGSFRDFDVKSFYLHRSELIKTFGKDFAVSSLPADFHGARTEGIALFNGLLIIGEYAINSSRIAIVTADACHINDQYNSISGVRHIHSIHKKDDAGHIFITTGDSRKMLDLWLIKENRLEFVERIKKRFAGYTAIVSLNGRYYFGSDFSRRPNYIETLDGKKYFFPSKAYKMQADAFFPFLNRYIISVNKEIHFGDRKALTVFDTVEEKFVFCDYLDSLLSGNDSQTISPIKS